MKSQNGVNLKNTSPYTVIEEEQFRIGLKSGAALGCGVGIVLGILTACAVFFLAYIPMHCV